MKKKITAVSVWLLLIISMVFPVWAADVPQSETPDYKVAFYAFDCFNMQDENGRKTGYGYEMMQGLANYMQCTFSYVGYDKTASECVDMLRNGEIDIYTAAKKTPEREKEFIFSTHPAITSTTCMNVKVGNNKIIAGDYSTYDGIRIGLLQRHTYNNAFLEFAKEKGFDCQIIYYETPTELTNALINDEVDALVNSYIRIPEDEKVIESFGETPYYLMARKEDQALIDQLDNAYDEMNVEIPNWRSDLYNQYYGEQEADQELTEAEQRLLGTMRANHTVIRAVTSPNANPYSWYEDGEAYGIAVDIFKQTVAKLGLDYEILPVSTIEDYQALLDSGDVDVWIDQDGYYDDIYQNKYKITDSYLTTTVSMLRNRSASEKIEKLAVEEDSVAFKEIISSTWPDAEVLVFESPEQCAQAVLDGRVNGALMLSYMAQKLSADDVQNRLRVDIVPGAEMSYQMGVNAKDTYVFYGLWEKTLAGTAKNISAEVVQTYIEESATPSMMAYLFDHPSYLLMICVAGVGMLFVLALYGQSVRSRNQQKKIAAELAVALEDAREANDSKQNFFSKMSHDIRTPLNVVLGMAQVAQKYKYDTPKLENALDAIATEGNYLLVLLNSILDVNQLEHGHVELQNTPFNVPACVRESVELLQPLAEKKEQQLAVECHCEDAVAVGDINRFRQIMINIVSNAIKYTNVGGTIRVGLTALPDNRYRFTCTDNGIGMSPEFIQHICEDYIRAEDSRVSKTQGTGLGMSVVKGFTELMKGTLTIESEEGKGSTFTVEIPFAEPTVEQREAILHPSVDENSETTQFIGKKVLLVEDNALNAEIATELLQSIGLKVDWADNGAVGVNCYRASGIGEYFAVFMDMQMPVMDGVEATREIRHSQRSDNDVPIFAMTANTFASDRKNCRDAGMDGYIPKPVSIKDITDTLKGSKNQL